MTSLFNRQKDQEETEARNTATKILFQRLCESICPPPSLLNLAQICRMSLRVQHHIGALLQKATHSVKIEGSGIDEPFWNYAQGLGRDFH